MNVKIHATWRGKLSEEFQKPYFNKLTEFIQEEYAYNTCYPKRKHIFAAFEHSLFEETKVVIIGQDPYHGQGQANGLCFSVSDGVAHPPSLVNIFKEIEADLGVSYPKSGNLERWAEQGVLLLNATLTVRAQEAGSHQNMGWEQFTDAAISKLSDERNNLIFLLWGGFAKKKSKLIDHTKHHIIMSGHPSPLSANRGYWFGNKHFSQTNRLLRQTDNDAINW